MMSEKHTVHLPNGDRVVIDGDRVEVHLAGPIVVHREHWIHYLLPREEVRRIFTGNDPARPIVEALEAAFKAVPMRVYREKDS